MFAAIFWDNDGVLMETEHLYFQANAEALAEVGVALTLAHFAEISLQQGESVLQLAGLSGEDDQRLRARRDRRYRELLAADAPVMPGAAEVLRQLHGRQPMAVVTSCRRPHFELMHRGSGLLGYFDFVLTREDYRDGKPDPEPYLAACARAGCAPADCLAVEDSPRGVLAAHRAGLTVAALPGSLNAGGDFAVARWRMQRLEELPALLAGIPAPI